MSDNHAQVTFVTGDSPAPLDLDGDEEGSERLFRAVHQLIDRIHRREEEVRRLLRVTESINRGLGLEEILEFLYQEFHPVIPFNRIGCALIDERRGLVVSHWAHSDRPVVLGKGFQAPLAGSTLADVVRTGQPRIINDLAAYLEQKPQSVSTQLIVREGMRSSLTCPLIERGRPVGFLFFSSEKPATYCHAHVAFFQQIAGQLSLIIEKGRLYSELAEQATLIDRQHRQLLEQLELARQFQRAMTPTEALRLPGQALAFAYRPALQVGGDMLDLMPLPGQCALVFVGDAMGHGVEAAMVMAAAKTALHTALRASSEPGELLRRVNEGLQGMLLGERYMTAVCARLDPVHGCAELALAGHPSPLHVSAATGAVTCPGDAGIPLGLRAGETFSAHTCPFVPGDTLVFFTDGVIEAKNSQGQFYGEERFLDLVRRHGRSGPAVLLRAIEDDLRAHCRNNGLDDDLTLLVVRSTPESNS